MIFRKTDDPSIFYLYDWKRTKKKSNKEYSRYVVQLNLYKFILERNYGIKITNMFSVFIVFVIFEWFMNELNFLGVGL
jgi:hypothetical protein